ncbi:hypothetical protein BDP55DRAFT_707307 [Colletotrichum godetiae]|uniref:Uncharacterized protein n=1 Tax=Colletotrichum godetiae TaxID=1209918 RepID=A0AAJ0EQY2_9PEZI|nr:uncharacterized protein BDP55DRAFT_707307 [Colletotrichum godetiae]KAK1660002.1 hypothetical protein BDP55DRAFT_707307 [Colletotrichum godetiae]
MDEKAASGADGPPDPTHPRTSAIDTEYHYPHRSDPAAFGRHSLQIIQQQKPTSRPPPDGQRQYGVTPNTRDEDIPHEKRSRMTNLPDIDTSRRRPASAPHPQPPSPRSPKNCITRPSHDFNCHYDGPFSRPSPAMTRRSTHSPTRPFPEPATSPHPDTAPGPSETPHRTLPAFHPSPPPLNYTLRTRKVAITLFWTLILIDSIAMPIALYFSLWYGVGPGTNTPTEKREKLSPNAVFSIVTAAVGGASIVEYFVRFWRLWCKGSTCRVIGAHRWYLDWFHWNFSLAWIIIMIELIVHNPKEPPICLLSLPAPTMLLTFGTQLLLIDVLRALHIPSPIRISSIPRHAQLRPGIYSLIEDICAVDGSGGTEFRVALDKRYEASHVFRAMLRRVGLFWAVGAEGCAVVCMVLVFTLRDGEVGYVVGWSLPFAWAGVWTGATFWYVKRELKREVKVWTDEIARKGVAGFMSMASV